MSESIYHTKRKRPSRWKPKKIWQVGDVCSCNIGTGIIRAISFGDVWISIPKIGSAGFDHWIRTLWEISTPTKESLYEYQQNISHIVFRQEES